MDSLQKRQIMDNSIIIKDVFGSHKILDDIEPYDIPEVIQFAKIIFNYKNMQEKLKEINKQ